MASLGVVVLAAFTGTASPGEPVETRGAPSAEWSAGVAAWGESSRLVVKGAAGEVVVVRCTAVLSPLRHEWTTEVALDDGGVAEVTLAVPAEAWLDPAASRYVTDLRVVVEGSGQVRSAPDAYVAWERGPTGPATVFAGRDLERLAPQGVLEASLRVEEVAGVAVRVMPDLSVFEAEAGPDAVRDSGGGGA